MFFEKFDRAGAKKFRTTFDSELAQLGLKYGLNITLGSLTFDNGGTIKAKVEAKIPGFANLYDEVILESQMKQFGLTNKIGKQGYMLTGFSKRSYKFPVLATKDGKPMKLSKGLAQLVFN